MDEEIAISMEDEEVKWTGMETQAKVLNASAVTTFIDYNERRSGGRWRVGRWWRAWWSDDLDDDIDVDLEDDADE